MLELINISHHVQRRGAEPLTVLDHVSFTAPGGHLLAVLGAAFSGKTTLINTLAGLCRVQSGAVVWNGRDVDVKKQPFHPNEFGYVSGDDSPLHDLLSVKENIVSALLLRVGGLSRHEALVRADKLMLFCGLDTVAGQRTATLAKPMRRRLALALALAPDPLLILCDDFTDGLDPKSERELAALLQLVAREKPGRLVINATQDLANLATYNSVVVLHEGRVCFHGPGRALTHYFSVPHTEDLYQRLAKRPSQRWQDSWNRHRDSYYAAFKLFSGGAVADVDLESAADDDDDSRPAKGNGERVKFAASGGEEDPVLPPPPSRPGFGTQLQVLLKRRWTMFRRGKTQLWQHIALLLGLPLVVVMLAWPEMEAMRAVLKEDANPAPAALMHTGHFASLLLLLQILGLVFMATRNGAREIASERDIWRREHLGGLRSSAYLASKIAFVAPSGNGMEWNGMEWNGMEWNGMEWNGMEWNGMEWNGMEWNGMEWNGMLGQSVWMGLCIDTLSGGLPGNGAMRLALMMLTSAAFTSLALGISAFSKSGDQASSRVWMLAFLQAPLSGALIALPGWLSAILHPLVTTFYGWSGCVETLKGSRIYEPLTKLNTTWFATPTLALIILSVHVLVGLGLASAGLRRAERS